MLGADSDDKDDNFDFEGNESAISLAVVQSALESSLQSEDRYVREAMDANFANGFNFETTRESTLIPLNIPSFGMHNESDGPNFTAIDPKSLGKLVKEAEKNEETRDYQDQDREVIPGVFIKECDVNSLIRTFSLNIRQQLAFRIICNHALGLHPPSEPQLLMGVFGEGGTGKSRLIDAIRTWFRWNG
jgi:hypothetical protein